ncbi:MAG: hypothetical protein ABSC94_33155, partial [Polyangiaceae bacterium]
TNWDGDCGNSGTANGHYVDFDGLPAKPANGFLLASRRLSPVLAHRTCVNTSSNLVLNPIDGRP